MSTLNSLPSFAQAFSSHSIAAPLENSNALPPIIHTKKRTNDEVRVKDESPPPDDSPHHDPAPSPSSTLPLQKKRRVTLSGPAALHIDTVQQRPPPPVDHPSSTPISPVVIGFTIQRDNPEAIEQVRSMISLKQKQKAIIEERRGSAAGIMSPTTAQPNPLTRRSPNNSTRRPPRPSSPQSTPMQVQQQQAILQQQQHSQPQPPPPPQHSLPPPPISFARRRAALLGGKKKPADIVISPREAHTRDQLAPAIQSAPPVPHAAGQASFYSGRFQMALPRLPNLAPDGNHAANVRRVPGNVPPTPTRLGLGMIQQQQQHGNPSLIVQQQQQQLPSRSPPAVPSIPISSSHSSASIPIASSLVPPTPTALHRPGYAGDKAAFLAPFEVFYDALNDSRQLKSWLAEQLAKSNALVQGLAQQQDRIQDSVDAAVEKRVSAIKAEVAALRRRVEELEGAAPAPPLRQQGYSRRESIDPAVYKNGVEQYTFPPIPSSSATAAAAEGPSRLRLERVASPGWAAQEGNPMGAPPNASGSGAGASTPRGGGGASGSGNGHASGSMRSPPPVFRERERESLRERDRERERERDWERERERERERDREREWEREREGSSGNSIRPPPLSRQGSSHSVPMVVVTGERERERERDAERERDRERDRDRDTQTRRAGSRRNSVVMAGPDEEERVS